MAISAKFLADFSDFDRGSKEASKNVLAFQTAVDRAGGRLMDFGETAGKGTAPQIQTLSGSLRSFDNVLDAVGIHLGAERRALQDFEAAAGQTVTQLGFLTTAGLAAGAALVGWKLGQQIDALTGLSGNIQEVTQRLMNWTAEGEEAAAVQDTIRRAVEAGAAATITYSEAIAFNQKLADDAATAHGRYANATRESARMISAWQNEIREVQKQRNFEALTRDLEEQHISLQKLSKIYGVTVEGLQYLVSRQKDAAAAAKEHERAVADLQKGWEQFYDWAADREAERQAQLKAGFEAWRRQEQAVKDNAGVLDSLLRKAAYEVALAEDAARDKAAGLNAELTKTPAIASAAGQAFQQTGGFLAGMTAELYSAIRAAQAYDQQRANAAVGGVQRDAAGRIALPLLAGGGPVVAGGAYIVGERGPELFRPNSSGTIIPNGGAGAVTISNTFNIVDTESNIARRVSDHLTRSIMQGRRLS